MSDTSNAVPNVAAHLAADAVLARIRGGERVDHVETIRRAKNGRLLNISLTVSPIKGESGKIVGASSGTGKKL